MMAIHIGWWPNGYYGSSAWVLESGSANILRQVTRIRVRRRDTAETLVVIVIANIVLAFLSGQLKHFSDC